MYEDLIKALRCCDAHCETCQFGDKERAYTCTVTGSAADAIEALQKQLIDYNHMSKLVDGKMSENQRIRRINEALQAENISLRAERDALLKAVEKPCVQERGD